MSDIASAKKALENIQGKWPKAAGSQPQADAPAAVVIGPAAQPSSTSTPESKKKTGGEALLASLSEREQKIVKDVIGKLDFAQFLVDNQIELEVPVRDDLRVTFCSPFASHVFDCQAYIRGIRNAAPKDADGKPDISELEETHHRLIWQLATDLRAFNGKKWMPGSNPIEHRLDRISRIREMPKHILEQVSWAYNLFNTALAIACDAESKETQDQLKNS